MGADDLGMYKASFGNDDWRRWRQPWPSLGPTELLMAFLFTLMMMSSMCLAWQDSENAKTSLRYDIFLIIIGKSFRLVG
jgi:hypothetical protein